MFADFIGEYDSFYGLLAAKDTLEEAFSGRCTDRPSVSPSGL